MIRLLKWIWQQIKFLGSAVATLASSVLTWVAAALAYIVDTISGWVHDAAAIAFSWVGIDLPTLHASDGGGLLGYWWNLLDIDEAFLALGTVCVAWVLARTARLVMVPIRAVLELL